MCVARRRTTLARASSTAASATSTARSRVRTESTSTSSTSCPRARRPTSFRQVRRRNAARDHYAWKEKRDEKKAVHYDLAGRRVGNARRNVDGDRRLEDRRPEQRDSREPRSLQHAPHERHWAQRNDERQARIRHHDPARRGVRGGRLHAALNRPTREATHAAPCPREFGKKTPGSRDSSTVRVAGHRASKEAKLTR